MHIHLIEWFLLLNGSDYFYCKHVAGNLLGYTEDKGWLLHFRYMAKGAERQSARGI